MDAAHKDEASLAAHRQHMMEIAKAIEERMRNSGALSQQMADAAPAATRATTMPVVEGITIATTTPAGAAEIPAFQNFCSAPKHCHPPQPQLQSPADQMAATDDAMHGAYGEELSGVFPERTFWCHRDASFNAAAGHVDSNNGISDNNDNYGNCTDILEANVYAMDAASAMTQEMIREQMRVHRRLREERAAALGEPLPSDLTSPMAAQYPHRPVSGGGSMQALPRTQAPAAVARINGASGVDAGAQRASRMIITPALASAPGMGHTNASTTAMSAGDGIGLTQASTATVGSPSATARLAAVCGQGNTGTLGAPTGEQSSTAARTSSAYAAGLQLLQQQQRAAAAAAASGGPMPPSPLSPAVAATPATSTGRINNTANATYPPPAAAMPLSVNPVMAAVYAPNVPLQYPQFFHLPSGTSSTLPLGLHGDDYLDRESVACAATATAVTEPTQIACAGAALTPLSPKTVSAPNGSAVADSRIYPMPKAPNAMMASQSSSASIRGPRCGGVVPTPRSVQQLQQQQSLQCTPMDDGTPSHQTNKSLEQPTPLRTGGAKAAASAAAGGANTPAGASSGAMGLTVSGATRRRPSAASSVRDTSLHTDSTMGNLRDHNHHYSQFNDADVAVSFNLEESLRAEQEVPPRPAFSATAAGNATLGYKTSAGSTTTITEAATAVAAAAATVAATAVVGESSSSDELLRTMQRLISRMQANKRGVRVEMPSSTAAAAAAARSRGVAATTTAANTNGHQSMIPRASTGEVMTPPPTPTCEAADKPLSTAEAAAAHDAKEKTESGDAVRAAHTASSNSATTTVRTSTAKQTETPLGKQSQQQTGERGRPASVRDTPPSARRLPPSPSSRALHVIKIVTPNRSSGDPNPNTSASASASAMPTTTTSARAHHADPAILAASAPAAAAVKTAATPSSEILSEYYPNARRSLHETLERTAGGHGSERSRIQQQQQQQQQMEDTQVLSKKPLSSQYNGQKPRRTDFVRMLLQSPQELSSSSHGASHSASDGAASSHHQNNNQNHCKAMDNGLTQQTRRSYLQRPETSANSNSNGNTSTLCRGRKQASYDITIEGHMRSRKEVTACSAVAIGTCVLFEGDRGVDAGRVVACRLHPDEAEVAAAAAEEGNANATQPQQPSRGRRSAGAMPLVLRAATAAEEEVWATKQPAEAAETLEPCREAVAALKLPLEIVGAVYQFNKEKLTFYYESDARVDFRQLLQNLFSRFHCRIWMERLATE